MLVRVVLAINKYTCTMTLRVRGGTGSSNVYGIWQNSPAKVISYCELLAVKHVAQGACVTRVQNTEIFNNGITYAKLYFCAC